MYSVIIVLIDPNDRHNNQTEVVYASTEARAVQLANALTESIQNKNPAIQANFSLRRKVWADEQFNQQSQEVLING